MNTNQMRLNLTDQTITIPLGSENLLSAINNYPAFYHQVLQNPWNSTENNALIKELFATPNTALYKTELCRSWDKTQCCPYGENCRFAHGVEQLRNKYKKHPKYKTVVCKTFQEKGDCPYGVKCQFIHSQEEANSSDGYRLSSGDNNRLTSMDSENSSRKGKKMHKGKILPRKLGARSVSGKSRAGSITSGVDLCGTQSDTASFKPMCIRLGNAGVVKTRKGGFVVNDNYIDNNQINNNLMTKRSKEVKYQDIKHKIIKTRDTKKINKGEVTHQQSLNLTIANGKMVPDSLVINKTTTISDSINHLILSDSDHQEEKDVNEKFVFERFMSEDSGQEKRISSSSTESGAEDLLKITSKKNKTFAMATKKLVEQVEIH